MDWACLLLATLDVALVHLVSASAIREAKSSSNVELGKGSERVGEWCVFIGCNNNIKKPNL